MEDNDPNLYGIASDKDCVSSARMTKVLGIFWRASY